MNSDPKQGALFIYDRNGGPKLSLAEGVIKWRECIEVLSYMKPLPPLDKDDELIVKVPKSEINWAKKDVFTEILEEKKHELGERYSLEHFHFDIGWGDPETSAVIQIVDDNKTFKNSRRTNILSKKASLVGISNQKNGNKNCVYILFGNKF